MKKYIGCDAHARYSIFASVREDGGWDPLVRVEHNELEMERFLKQLPAGSAVALESSGDFANLNWALPLIWCNSWCPLNRTATESSIGQNPGV